MNQRLAAYLEQRILSADPIELIRILYQSAIGEIREARRHLAAGDIPARSKAITKSFDILAELSRSLDIDMGGEIGIALDRLYDYMRRQLLDANFRQADEPLGEVLSLLSTLLEGWEKVPTPSRGPVAIPTWTPEFNRPVPEYAPQVWSL